MQPDVLALYVLRTVQVDFERSIHSLWTVRPTYPPGTHEIAVNPEDEYLARTMLALLQLAAFGCAVAALRCRRPDMF